MSKDVSQKCGTCGTQLRAGARFCDGCGRDLAADIPGAQERYASQSPPGAGTPTDGESVGSVGSGRYRLLRLLGEGGSKKVYLARDEAMEREVAVGIFHADFHSDDDKTRIRREAQSMARLSEHPGIVPVFDVGDEREGVYIVSEYMAGGDLEALLHSADGGLELEDALRIGAEVAEALEYTHSHGIIHRDIKPANIWMSDTGKAKIGDFGLAVAVDRSRITQTGMILGTALYLPPECATSGSKNADARSDIYALGATLYEVVTGEPPFTGETAEVISQHIHTSPVLPSRRVEGLPSAVNNLLLRMLAKAPSERPKTAGEVASALWAMHGQVTGSGAGRQTSSSGAVDLARSDNVVQAGSPAGSVLVGREEEMSELVGALDEAVSGLPRTVLLVGEPGIGKTRLTEELRTYAELRGAILLTGKCLEGEGTVPFLPWIQVLRSVCAWKGADTVGRFLGSAGAEIATLLPEIEGHTEAALDDGRPTSPEQLRLRLFDGITELINEASREKPILLVLEDLHWADAASLLVLEHLALRTKDASVLTLGTYRDVELGRHHPLAKSLSTLTREGKASRIVLRGLTEEHAARFIESMAGREPPAGLASALHHQTEGNPFFMSEVVQLLVSTGAIDSESAAGAWSDEIPEGVKEVIGQRLNRLSEDCNTVLSVASVIGREFDTEVLLSVSRIGDDETLDALDEAEAARLIAAAGRGGDRFEFTHALTRATLYSELPTSRRARIHRAVGGAIEELCHSALDAHLGELALHFLEGRAGGALDKAIDYQMRAADQALRLLAYEEAAGLYERVLEIVEIDETAERGLAGEALLGMGRAKWRASDIVGAKEALMSAANLARGLDDPHLLARAALEYGGTPRGTGTEYDGVVRSLLSEAIGGLPDSDSMLKARLLARQAGAPPFSKSVEEDLAYRSESFRLVDDAVGMSRRIGDEPTLIYALLAQHDVHLTVGHEVEPRLAAAEELVQLATQSGDLEALFEARSRLLGDCLAAGDIERVDIELEELAGLVTKLKQEFLAGQVLALRSMRALMKGDLADSEQLANDALRVAMGIEGAKAIGVMTYAIQVASIRIEQKRFGEMARMLAVFVEQTEEYIAARGFRAGLALAYSQAGEAEKAGTELGAAVDSDAGSLVEGGSLGNTVFAVGACSYLEDRARAELLYEVVAPFKDHNVVVWPGVVCMGSAARYLGQLAATMARYTAGEEHFEAAIAANQRMGALPFVAHSKHEFAAMLLDRDEPGDSDRARSLLAEAVAEYDAINMSAFKAAAEELLGT